MMKEYSINNKKYRLNLFEKIENEKQAYLIGYLCGDGGISTENKKRKNRLCISSTYEETITVFKNEFCPDSTVSSRVPINNTEGYNIKTNKPSFTLTFSSKFSNTFNKFGILSKKENRRLVNIPKKSMKHYLLGLFDADGCISWGKRKDRNRLWSNFQITHQSMDVLSKIQTYIMEELNIATSIKPRKTEKCFDLRTSNRNHIVKLYEFLYKKRSIFYNKKKHSNFKKFVEEFNI